MSFQSTSVSFNNPAYETFFFNSSQKPDNKAEERSRLSQGSIEGLRVTIDFPKGRGEKLHNQAITAIGRYQERDCKLDSAGQILLLTAQQKLTKACDKHDIDESQRPLLALRTVSYGIQTEVGQHNEHLSNYLNGGARSELTKAVDELKEQVNHGDKKVMAAYLTSIALCQLNNYR